jgi:hypothetical protein
MFNKKLLVVGLISSALMVGCNKEAEKPDESAMLTTLEQKVNYVDAQKMAQNFKQGG